MSVRTKTGLLILVVALISGGAGFYFGLGKGAQIMGTLASQNNVSEALSDVRTSMMALKADDPASMKRKVSIDLRLALFSLDALSSAVPFFKCSDRDREDLTSAADYIAAHADPKILNSSPEFGRGLRFCTGR